MISVELRGGFQHIEKFVSRLRLFLLAEGLGGVESLVCYPPWMTHSALSRNERIKRGIRIRGINLVRLSVGIENKIDLKEDLQNTLS